MRFTKLHLKNWCQHRDLTVEFHPGLNGILGSNGSGKSNLLDAGRFLLTGQSVNHGNKRDNLTWEQKSGYVEGEFMVGGATYRLRRAIESSKVKLTIDDREIVKADEVERELIQLFGADTEVLLNNVFVEQGKIDSILYATPTKRLKEFQETFGLTKIEEAFGWLNREANTYLLTPGLIERLQDLTQAILSERRDIVERTGQLDEVVREIATLEPAARVLERALEAARTEQLIRQADQRVTALEQALATAAVERDRLDAEATALGRLLDQTAPRAQQVATEIDETERSLARWQQAQQLRAQEAALTAQIEALGPVPSVEELGRLQLAAGQADQETEWNRRLLSSPQARPLFPREQELTAERDQIDVELRGLRQTGVVETSSIRDLRARLVDLDRQVRSIGDGRCPTCGQTVHGGPDEARKLNDQRAEVDQLLKTQLAQLAQQLTQQATELEQRRQAAVTQLAGFEQAAVQALRQALQDTAAVAQQAHQVLRHAQTRRASREALDNQLAAVGHALVGAPAVQPDVERLETLRRFHVEHSGFVAKHKDVSLRLDYARQGFDRATTDHRAAVTFRAEIGQTVQAPTAEEIVRAKDQMILLSARRVDEHRLQQQLGIGQAAIQAREAEAERLRAQIKQETDAAAWIDVVTRARDVLHVTQLPSMVMTEYGELVNARIAYYLSLWEVDFRMWLDDQLAFRVRFSDGREHDAARLSGGQKVMASASFRLAMSDIFAQRVSLLVLDEPSNHLDRDNIEHLQRLLLKLKELSIHSGRQILIVTHEDSLTGFLDHVVEVK